MSVAGWVVAVAQRRPEAKAPQRGLGWARWLGVGEEAFASGGSGMWMGPTHNLVATCEMVPESENEAGNVSKRE
jgi:hypothetical protein